MNQRFQYVGIRPHLPALSAFAASSARARIQQGLDVNDQPAPPLSKGWAKAKAKLGRKPIRDWTASGFTLAHLVALPQEGRISAGFDSPQAAQRAAINNARSQQYPFSPRDRQALIAEVSARSGSFIKAV